MVGAIVLQQSSAGMLHDACFDLNVKCLRHGMHQLGRRKGRHRSS